MGSWQRRRLVVHLRQGVIPQGREVRYLHRHRQPGTHQ